MNSPGGAISAGLAIYDTMQLARCDIATICVGMCASMATVLLTAGAKGKRYALPHSTIHIHQARGGATGEAADIEIYAKEILRNQQVIRDILARHTGQDPDRIARDSDRNFFMDADQAREYGIIDEILHAGETAAAAGETK
jgi:ATP-dependent Clp protease protease subunit